MTIKLFVTEVEGYDDANDAVFRVKAFDESAVEVELTATVHNTNSWAETAAAIGQAIAMMDLEGSAATDGGAG